MHDVNPPGGRWTDDRIQDLAEAVWSMRDVPMRVAVLENNFDQMAQRFEGDLAECKTGIQSIINARDQERKERDERERVDRERRESERKTERRWQVGTALTSVGLVIAALAIFLG